eukprot:4632098-Pleurochrysis_carterae.AAC.1
MDRLPHAPLPTSVDTGVSMCIRPRVCRATMQALARSGVRAAMSTFLNRPRGSTARTRHGSRASM